MSIITVRCRLVAGVKQQIDKKSIKDFSKKDRALLQKLLKDRSQSNKNVTKGKEKIFLAQSSQNVRQHLWEMFLINSSLVDELLDRLSQHENFQAWRQQGELPDDELKACWQELKSSPSYNEKLPEIFFYSIKSMVKTIYASWLAVHRKKQQRLDGLNRLIQIVYSDKDLLKICQCQFEQLQANTRLILAEIDKEIANAEKPLSRINLLFKKYTDISEEDISSRSAIAYLIRHGCKIEPEIEPTPKFTKWFRTKLKQAERLKTQLAGHFPRGRDLNDTAFLKVLETATKDEPQDNRELMLWQSQILRDPSSLPHPIEFNSNMDLRWLKLYRKQYKCKRTVAGASIDSIELTQRLFVEFKGLTRGTNYVFEVYCDRRQLAIFQQFLNDYRLLQNSSSDEKSSSSLFTLRSAHLLWERKESQDRYRHRTLSDQTADEPWNTNQLYLHCAIETKSLTAEGMREIQQQKTQKVNNTLDKQSKNTDPNIDQQRSQRKNQTTQALLNRSLPRPKCTTLVHLTDICPLSIINVTP